ncbi:MULTISPECIES: nuclear transport factor 2 family protein [Acinetobacter]|uniref:nuclear transport factor 2 family protein n=1 Tax=Acinetobacter TaxID=469 RepID=UPI0005C5F0A5|nr:MULTISPECIES: nuclear transport factor 2 family protein [Acinetobacter]
MKKVFILITLLFSTTLSGCNDDSKMDSEPQTTNHPQQQQLEQNKALVKTFYEGVFVAKKVKEFSDRYISENYIQHNPYLPDGRQAFVDFFEKELADHPDAEYSIERIIAEDDLVLLHVRSKLNTEVATNAGVDLFRIANGVIVEHWDTNQDVPENERTAANPEIMFNGNKNHATSPAHTSENKALVTTFVKGVFEQHKVREFSERYLADHYIQHNPWIENGREPFISFFEQLFQADPAAKYQIKRVIAEGDLVAVQLRSKLSNEPENAGFDIFRVENAKIVEHWDVNQAVPENSANSNTMF